MLSLIKEINSAVNNFIWGVPAMICIIGVGLVLSIRTGFLQIRKFPYAMKVTIGRMFKKKEAADGAMTPFQAVCTALAATVGTGNIAGVAGAIAIGGPGAVFWMWISAILGMCTKFSEVTLAVHFREKRENAVVKNKNGRKIKYKINRKPSTMKKLSKSGQYAAKKAEHKKSSVRAKVEHVFAVVKRLFGYRKTRYRGLRKQTAKLNIMFAPANLYPADRKSLTA